MIYYYTVFAPGNPSFNSIEALFSISSGQQAPVAKMMEMAKQANEFYKMIFCRILGPEDFAMLKLQKIPVFNIA